MVRRNSIIETIAAGFFITVLVQPRPAIAQILDRELGRPEAHWESVSNFESMDHRILTCMEFGDLLIVGGEFNGAGGVVLNHIATWDGSHWSPLGDGLNFSVRCLGIYQGQLIAGGDFTASGGRELSHVARWNGQEWEGIGEGFDGSPTCFVEWNGRLVAGGVLKSINQKNSDDRFFYSASWDGTEWTPMGNDVDFTALSAPPRDLIVYKGLLYAAGSFTPPTSSKTTLSQPMARWTGSEWLPVGPPMIPYMGTGKPSGTCFALFDSLLVIGGSFTRLDTLNANGIAAFDGQVWSALGEGCSNGPVDLQVYGGRLFAAGVKFENRVAVWDGSSWSGIIGTPVRALASYDDLLFAVGGTEIGEIQTWDGTQLQWVGPVNPNLSKVPGPVQALVTYQNKVLLPNWYWNVAPYAPRDVDDVVNHQGQGTGLHEFHGQPAWDYLGPVPSAVFHSTLVFGWNTWDGSTVGRLPNTPFWYPLALTVWGDSLIAAAWPDCFASTELWSWNGQSWNPMAGGLCPSQVGEWEWETEGIIRVLSPYGDKLLAGGFFTYSDGQYHNLAAWNGTNWDPLGASPDNMVTCLLEYHGDLIAAGFFDHIGSLEASHIARWDGTRWHAMGLGVDGPVYTLAIHNDRLIAGGFFDHADGLEAGSIASWDGEGWVPLGTGVDGEVLAMASNEGTLWVGGEFSKAGGQMSFHLAKWAEGPRTATFSNFTVQRTANSVVIEGAANYLPFDHQGFLIYRQAQGEAAELLLTQTPITSDEFSFTDSSPPLGPVTYILAGIASTGAVTRYTSSEIASDPALRFALLPVRPNPSHAQATITFHNAKTGLMHVAVFDLRGRLVADLLDETLPPGAHSVTWAGRDLSGRSVAAGTYFCRVTGPEGTRVKQLVRSTP